MESLKNNYSSIVDLFVNTIRRISVCKHDLIISLLEDLVLILDLAMRHDIMHNNTVSWLITV